MEEMLIDTPCFRRFAVIETMEERILEGVNTMLSERGGML
jgi:hypothetical protein